MNAISLAITQFFTACSVLFTAFESICKTLLNLATVAEESSATYMDQARHDRQVAINQRKLELTKTTTEVIELPNVATKT